MDNKSCCFTGHRVIYHEDSELVVNLNGKIESLINSGVTDFYSGGARGFDMIGAESVINFRDKYPKIRLILVLPCIEQDRYWNSNQKKRYEEIKQNADEIIYISESYSKGCMQKRNRYLVDNSSVCVAYLRRKTGGTAYTVSYAEKKGVSIIRI